ncbi:MAG TPA: hypothetical protein VFG87_09430 [Amycolatopsis sp.]|jgi:hypothetical protein|nr:hypothetical protein [Amycolatopsis sp.]
MDCRSCLSGLDHCHGTLVVHENGDPECTAPCADIDEARHRLLVTCAELDGGCRCAVEVGAGEPAGVS